jgi:hypothetical protein
VARRNTSDVGFGEEKGVGAVPKLLLYLYHHKTKE